MKTSAITAVFLTALLVAGAVEAQSGAWDYQPRPYFGAAAMFWELERDDRSDDFDSLGGRLHAGVELNDYLAIEGHLGTGGSDGPANLDYVTGGYLKGILPVTRSFKVYGLLGGSEVEFDRQDDAENDFSYGAGASFAVMPNLAIAADYMNYLDKSDVDFEAISIGVRYNF